jgi:hypothetical protein
MGRTAIRFTAAAVKSACYRSTSFDRFAVLGDHAAAENKHGFLSFALRAVRSVFVDGLFMKRRPFDLEQATETAWTTITLVIRQVKS